MKPRRNLAEALAAAAAPFEADEAERRHAFEERAAIMEYDGGMSRAEAERCAAADCANRIMKPRAPQQVDPRSERHGSARGSHPLVL